MIDYIEGRIVERNIKYVVLACNNIGYSINMAEYEIRKIGIDEEIKVFIRMIVREDSITFYGFLDKNTRLIFDLLTTVSSIGPKLGLGILSSMQAKDIVSYIKNSNIEKLTQAPGVGKKTAQRIVLELKDKLKDFDLIYEIDNEDNFEDEDQIGSKEPAIEALVSLGYNKYEALKALNDVDMSLDIREIIKQALKNLGR